MINLKRAIGGFLLSLVFLLFFTYMIYGMQSFLKNSSQSQAEDIFLGNFSNGVQNVVTQNEDKKTDVRVDAATTQSTVDQEITAESAISIESDLLNVRNVIFKKNSGKKLPIASLTKLMTAIVVLDNYDLSDIVTVNKAADLQDPMKQDVKLGDAMPAKNFLDIMLIESSNKSAYALSELMGTQKFVDLMNQKAKSLGLKNTFFEDPTGLSPQNVSTASDLTELAEYIFKNYPKIADISMVKELYIPTFGTALNTDELLGEMPNIVFGKTGFTIEAKGCLLLVLDNPKNNNYLINVILGADDRFSEMKKLVNRSEAILN